MAAETLVVAAFVGVPLDQANEGEPALLEAVSEILVVAHVKTVVVGVAIVILGTTIFCVIAICAVEVQPFVVAVTV